MCDVLQLRALSAATWLQHRRVRMGDPLKSTRGRSTGKAEKSPNCVLILVHLQRVQSQIQLHLSLGNDFYFLRISFERVFKEQPKYVTDMPWRRPNAMKRGSFMTYRSVFETELFWYAARLYMLVVIDSSIFFSKPLPHYPKMYHVCCSVFFIAIHPSPYDDIKYIQFLTI